MYNSVHMLKPTESYNLSFYIVYYANLIKQRHYLKKENKPDTEN